MLFPCFWRSLRFNINYILTLQKILHNFKWAIVSWRKKFWVRTSFHILASCTLFANCLKVSSKQDSHFALPQLLLLHLSQSVLKIKTDFFFSFCYFKLQLATTVIFMRLHLKAFHPVPSPGIWRAQRSLTSWCLPIKHSIPELIFYLVAVWVFYCWFTLIFTESSLKIALYNGAILVGEIYMYLYSRIYIWEIHVQ